jgi:hypothetical protein
MKRAAPVPFVVGRIARGGRKVIVMETAAPAPIPGPWDLRAIVVGAPQPVRLKLL